MLYVNKTHKFLLLNFDTNGTPYVIVINFFFVRQDVDDTTLRLLACTTVIIILTDTLVHNCYQYKANF